MSTSVSPLPEDRLVELHTLATAALNEELSDEQIVRLDRLVCEDENFRRLYIRYMYVSWNLRTWAKFPLPSDAEDQLQPPSPDADAILLDQLASLDAEPAHGSALLVGSNAFHGTVGYFSSGWPVAYLVATVIFAIGLLVGSQFTCPSRCRLPSNPSLYPLLSPLSPQWSAGSPAWSTASGR